MFNFSIIRRKKMSFKNLKKKEKKNFKGKATSAQMRKFIDAYSETGNRTGLKHLLKGEFEGDFSAQLDENILLMKRAEGHCVRFMNSEDPPTSLTALRSELNKAEPESVNTVIDYLVGKIVGATGTFKEYQDCFKKEV